MRPALACSSAPANPVPNSQEWCLKPAGLYTRSKLISALQPVGGLLTDSRKFVCSANPVPNSQEWCLETGQDFLPNHFLSSIDYAGAPQPLLQLLHQSAKLGAWYRQCCCSLV